ASRSEEHADDEQPPARGLGQVDRRRAGRNGDPRPLPAGGGDHQDHRKELPPAGRGAAGDGLVRAVMTHTRRRSPRDSEMGFQGMTGQKNQVPKMMPSPPNEKRPTVGPS